MNLLYKEFNNKDYTIKVYREYYFNPFKLCFIYLPFKKLKENLVFSVYKNDNNIGINKIYECKAFISINSKSIINYIKKHRILSRYFDGMREK